LVEVASAEYWLPSVSNTFHGRDIFAPVAAQLSLGLEPERLGPAVSEIAMLDWLSPRREERRIEGVVDWIDGFGNLITNIPGELLAEARQLRTSKVSCRGGVVTGLSTTYGERAMGELLALVGSGGKLEVAVVGGSAARRLNADIGDPVVVQW
jgi:S-adenosylmethionine hydrolase